MGISYEFFNPDNGKSLNYPGDKFDGMPFFDEEYGNIQIHCAIEENFDTNTITHWTINEEDPLYKDYFSYMSPWWTDYITRDMAIKLQEKMNCNKTLLTDFMDEAGCDALIMDVSY